jgi:hypothetical protein
VGEYTGDDVGEYTGGNVGEYTGGNVGEYTGDNVGEYTGDNVGEYTGDNAGATGTVDACTGTFSVDVTIGLVASTCNGSFIAYFIIVLIVSLE